MEKEKLKEAAEKLYPYNPFWIGSGKNARLYDEFKTQRDSFIEGAKWQTERMYSIDFIMWYSGMDKDKIENAHKRWINETFKSE
jgi:hypothetical protein